MLYLLSVIFVRTVSIATAMSSAENVTVFSVYLPPGFEKWHVIYQTVGEGECVQNVFVFFLQRKLAYIP